MNDAELKRRAESRAGWGIILIGTVYVFIVYQAMVGLLAPPPVVYNEGPATSSIPVTPCTSDAECCRLNPTIESPYCD